MRVAALVSVRPIVILHHGQFKQRPFIVIDRIAVSHMRRVSAIIAGEWMSDLRLRTDLMIAHVVAHVAVMRVGIVLLLRHRRLAHAMVRILHLLVLVRVRLLVLHHGVMDMRLLRLLHLVILLGIKFILT